MVKKMVIFDKKEQLEFNKEEQKQLEMIEPYIRKIIELNRIKDPYGHIINLLDYEILDSLVSHFYNCLTSKVFEVYKKERELNGLLKEV